MNPTPKQASEYQGGFFMQGAPPAYRQAGSAGQNYFSNSPHPRGQPRGI